MQNGALYAFKGLAGKLGPIGVHASMLAVMAGVVVGALGGFTGTAMVPEGGDLLIADALRGASPLAPLPAGGSGVLHVDDFLIDYRPDGSVRQFYTDVSGARGGGEGGELLQVQPAGEEPRATREDECAGTGGFDRVEVALEGGDHRRGEGVGLAVVEGEDGDIVVKGEGHGDSGRVG